MNNLAIAPYVLDASWTSYGYDLRGRQISVTRWNGGVPPTVNGIATGGTATGYLTTTTLDQYGNVLGTVAPGNRIVTMSYGGVSSNHAAMRQMLSQTVSPDGGTTQVTSNYQWVDGERRSVTDNLSQVTSFTYNGRGQLLTTSYHDSTSTSSVYYDSGQQYKAIDELGREAIMQYDAYGRQTSYQAPGKAPNQTVHRVMSLGGVDHMIDATGRRVDYEYYDDGQREKTIVAEGTSDEAMTTYYYDRDNLTTSTTDPVGMITSIGYDKLGRRSTVTVPGKNAADLLTTSTTYLTAQDKVITTHPDTTTSTIETDELGRTITSINENGEEMKYFYQNETSWMTSLIDARLKETKWTYNDLGQMLSKVYPGGVEVDSYTYDGGQRLHTHTRPSQKRGTYSYDARNRVTQINWDSIGSATLYGAGENQEIDYFDDGRVERHYNGDATISYTYDPVSGDPATVIQSHNGQSWTVAYNHDDVGRLTDLTYPTAGAATQEVAYHYNQRGDLQYVYNPDDGNATPLATYLRRKDSLITRLTYDNHSSGNGSQTRYYYDTGKRSTGRYHHNPNGGFQDKNQYGYDNRSRRIWQEWSGNTGDRYEYDLAGQIENVDHGVTNPEGATGALTPDQSFTYDAMGNRQTFTVTSGGASANILAGSNSYTANDKNQYGTITGPSSPPQGSWSYDLDGNLTDDGTRLFTWDAWNRLREVRLKSNNTLLGSYSYDALGRRVNKVAGSESTTFVYDGWNVIQEYSGTALHAYLVWGEDLSGSLQGAGGVGGLLMRAASDGTAYFHYDANGNPARLATSAGGWWGKYRYDAFGNIRQQVGNLANQNPWRFSTKYRDAETGFSYYGYRYYDPVTGRWPSRDPIGELGGENLYCFVGNDGVDFWDFLGLAITLVPKDDCLRDNAGNYLYPELCDPDKEEEWEVIQAGNTWRHILIAILLGLSPEGKIDLEPDQPQRPPSGPQVPRGVPEQGRRDLDRTEEEKQRKRNREKPKRENRPRTPKRWRIPIPRIPFMPPRDLWDPTWRYREYGEIPLAMVDVNDYSNLVVGVSSCEEPFVEVDGECRCPKSKTDI